jgi:hypothetical protein
MMHDRASADASEHRRNASQMLRRREIFGETLSVADRVTRDIPLCVPNNTTVGKIPCVLLGMFGSSVVPGWDVAGSRHRALAARAARTAGSCPRTWTWLHPLTGREHKRSEACKCPLGDPSCSSAKVCSHLSSRIWQQVGAMCRKGSPAVAHTVENVRFSFAHCCRCVCRHAVTSAESQTGPNGAKAPADPNDGRDSLAAAEVGGGRKLFETPRVLCLSPAGLTTHAHGNGQRLRHAWSKGPNEASPIRHSTRRLSRVPSHSDQYVCPRAGYIHLRDEWWMCSVRCRTTMLLTESTVTRPAW